MNTKYESILERLFIEFSSETQMRQKIGTFAYRVGEFYSKDGIMLCGRAPNGSEYKYSKSYLNKNAYKVIQKMKVKENDLEWMDTYSSSFIKIGKKTCIEILGIEPSVWTKKIIWTNLMKLSPGEHGNPSERDWRIQKSLCMKLLKMEIDHFEPKNILMLTDFDWADEFLRFLKIDSYDTKDTLGNHMIKGHYKYRKSDIILGNRPEYRKHDRYLSEIRKYIKI